VNTELRLKDATIISFTVAIVALAVACSIDYLPLMKTLAVVGVIAWILMGVSCIRLTLHLGFVASPTIRRSEEPIMFWASLTAWSAMWLIFLVLICISAWSLWLKTPPGVVS